MRARIRRQLLAGKRQRLHAMRELGQADSEPCQTHLAISATSQHDICAVLVLADLDLVGADVVAADDAVHLPHVLHAVAPIDVCDRTDGAPLSSRSGHGCRPCLCADFRSGYADFRSGRTSQCM